MIPAASIGLPNVTFTGKNVFTDKVIKSRGLVKPNLKYYQLERKNLYPKKYRLTGLEFRLLLDSG